MKDTKITNIEILYDSKTSSYFNLIREDLISEIPCGPNRILDIGCGSGATGFALKQKGKASYVVGIEISDTMAKIAKNQIDIVILGNIEELQLDLQSEEFDFILLGDVLEHLINPWEVLNKIKNYLKPNGRIIASIPNVRCWKVLLPLLLKGNWEYAESGLLDMSHLRFFTKKSMIALFTAAKLKIYKSCALINKKTKTKYIDIMTFGFLKEFLTSHYLFVLGK
ncbi:MAG: class I SAM-dependent methyltransferase [Elusimicrobia bacterium]|nr:class I SAM-dependent methyltransferase [Elusimicrobiota bacterium]